MEDGRVRVAHVITGLEIGGAEMMLYRLLARMDAARFSSHVYSLSGRGALAAKIEDAGVAVTSFDMSGTVRGLLRLPSLIGAVRRFEPHVIQTWLYHADFVGLIVQRLAGAARLCWNLRCAELRPGDVSSAVLRLVRMLSFCSRLPDAVVVNSLSGKRAHESIGYHPRRWLVLYNGFDTDLFRPNAETGAALREKLGLRADATLIGMVARFDPMKDHDTFLRAAARVAETKPGVSFVLIGRGMDASNAVLAGRIEELNLRRAVVLLGECADVFRLMPGLDVVVSSSSGEGLPNVIGEAMACGVPCVATDVGDTSVLVGDAGVLVPARDVNALASACIKLVDLPSVQRADMGRRARARIIGEFSLASAVDRYQDLYEELAAK